MKRATAIGFATSLSAARTVGEVDAVIRSGLAAVVEASGAILGIVDADERVIRLQLSDLLADDRAALYEALPLDAAGPFKHVIDTREQLMLRDDADWRRYAPDRMVEDVLAAGLVTMVCTPLLDRSGEVVATLAVVWTDVVDVDVPTLTTIGTVAELCEQTLERARATDQATERATQLARLAERLADAMTVTDALATIVQSGQKPVGASVTSIGLVDHDAGVLVTHHGETINERVRARFTDPPLDARLAITDAARLNEPVLLGDHASYVARYPDSADVVAELGFGARSAVPVRTAGGRVIGSIGHAWAGPRAFDEALVSTLSTIAEMAGQAIERARLVEQIQIESARHEALASLAELLASARTSSQVARVVAVHTAAVAGADSANLALLDPRGGDLQVHHNPNLAPEVQDRYRSVALDAPIPHADALRERTTLVFQDLDEFAGRYPHLVDELKEAGRQACAVVPLVDSLGDPLGALGFAWTDPVRLDDAAHVVLDDVADLCSQALERARLSDAEHHLVTTLQESVLTPLPAISGLDIAARYLPAARHIGMGGDWYQGIVIDDHRYAVIVGDVAGHGITAVGDMAQLKAVIGALVRIGWPLGRVFSETTGLLRTGDRNVTATAMVAVIDIEAQTLTYSVAGHPPPLLRTPDGEVTVLNEGRQPLLGVFTDAMDELATRSFPAGSTLVAYTDGLVERRREQIDLSIDRLADDLRAAGTATADAVASHLLVSKLTDDEPDDDIALVVVTGGPRVT